LVLRLLAEPFWLLARQHGRSIVRIPMHPAMHSNMKPAGDSDLIPATLLASTGPFR